MKRFDIRHAPLRAVAATWVLAVAALAGTTASAQPAPAAAPAQPQQGASGAAGHGGMRGHGPMHGHGHHGSMHGDGHGGGHMGMGMPMGSRQIARALDLVNATPEQRTQIRQIVAAAAADLRAQREGGRALHDQAQALLTQPNIDANAAEQLRQQMLARHDQASKRMLQAALDAARVLTPEQRKLLGERMQQRRAAMERHHAAKPAAEGASRPAR